MFGTGFWKQEDCLHKLKQIQKKLPQSAEDSNKSSCTQCSLCCWRKSCELQQEDLIKIASFLNITTKELFSKYLCIERLWLHTDYLIMPIRKEQKDIAGKFIPSDRSFDINTPCIFLDEAIRKCSIHDAMPTGGKNFQCWANKESKLIEWKKEEVMKLGWNGDEDWDEEDDDSGCSWDDNDNSNDDDY